MSNIELDRKILANLAQNEPYSFKCVVDEVKVQANFKHLFDRKPMSIQTTAVSLPEAFARGLLTPRKRKEEIEHILKEEPKPDIYGLRFPEKDGKTDADYMRISLREEDEKWLEEQKRL